MRHKRVPPLPALSHFSHPVRACPPAPSAAHAATCHVPSFRSTNTMISIHCRHVLMSYLSIADLKLLLEAREREAAATAEQHRHCVSVSPLIGSGVAAAASSHTAVPAPPLAHDAAGASAASESSKSTTAMPHNVASHCSSEAPSLSQKPSRSKAKDFRILPWMTCKQPSFAAHFF